MRLGLAAALMLIALIGGRIIPSFTRNWLSARKATRLPLPFSQADAAILGVTGLCLAVFVTAPDSAAGHWLMLLTGALHLWRMSRWCGWQIRPEPLLWVLHKAYGLLALGFLAEAAAGFGLLPVPTARHIWLAGAIGLMTLAVMCRATLGHTGRTLHAGPTTTAIFVALLVSILARVLAGIAGNATWLMHLSGGAWILAFAGYAVIYGPMLARPRVAKKQPTSMTAKT